MPGALLCSHKERGYRWLCLGKSMGPLTLGSSYLPPHCPHCHISLFLYQLGPINKNSSSCYFIFPLFPVVYIDEKKGCLEQYVLPKKFIILF